ncbi:DUF2061 domain-containing protein [Xenophilus arseniciresistens]|uniref:DUF2061 domain-containing protein n=1 Tax=Xenophilus arseniciresistens TaxID=1283306 RepID=A0AAE3NCR6_9BURK|nr:DUF2061 domain-containing protein [Xenophilus arseniciresistens]MDA7419178.1 DUF2061 domain-containing protein [Xenophilus arseniciresistens]
MRRLIRPHLPALQKTASYYVLHITVAAMVAYAVTGNFWMALTLSLLEPSVQAVAFFFHEKVWERRQRTKASPRAAMPSALAVPQPAAAR